MASCWREPTGGRFYRPVDTGPLAKLGVFFLPLQCSVDHTERSEFRRIGIAGTRDARSGLLPGVQNPDDVAALIAAVFDIEGDLRIRVPEPCDGFCFFWA